MTDSDWADLKAIGLDDLRKLIRKHAKKARSEGQQQRGEG
jgi:hypothetical protein